MARRRLIPTSFQGRLVTTRRGGRGTVLRRVTPKLGFFGRLVRL